jgi:hypothetical protein
VTRYSDCVVMGGDRTSPPELEGGSNSSRTALKRRLTAVKDPEPDGNLGAQRFMSKVRALYSTLDRNKVGRKDYRDFRLQSNLCISFWLTFNVPCCLQREGWTSA